MSIAYYPETDGLTERVIQILEHYLRTFCNFEQETWREMFLMAEYAYNNSGILATAISPIYTNSGYHPRTNFEIEAEAQNGWSPNCVN
jgi:hypothetical protein